MAENFPPHPKVNRFKPRSQSIVLHRYLWSQVLSQVSQENLQPFTGLWSQMAREAVNQMFSAPSPFSSCTDILFCTAA